MVAVRTTGILALADTAVNGGPPTDLLVLGFVVLVVLLLGALINNARVMGGLALAALGCFARTVGTIVFGGVVLVLLVIAMASGSTGSRADTPAPAPTTTAPTTTAPTTTAPAAPPQQAGPRAGG